MDTARAMRLIAAREWRINSRRAAGWAAAAAAYSDVINAVADKAPSLRAASEFAACFQLIVDDTVAMLRREAAAKVALSAANAIDALADRPCEVARWNMATRGQRLPLP